MILYCQLRFPIDKHPGATVHTIEHEILPSECNQLKQLIDHTPSETADYQVQTWTSAYQTTESESLMTTGTTNTNKSPFNRRLLTILLGRASNIYYIRINLTNFQDRWVSSHISITSDGRTFFRYRGDLGPMVTQIIAYQNEEKRFFAVGPQRSSFVSTRDLTGQWTRICLSEYSNYIDGKNRTNATYLSLLWGGGGKHGRLTSIYVVRSVQNSQWTTGTCTSTVFTTKTRRSQFGRTKPVYDCRHPAEQISQVYHGVTAYSAQPHISVLCISVLLNSFVSFVILCCLHTRIIIERMVVVFNFIDSLPLLVLN
ncbi:hypothetical protein FGIG_03127 [Fasciola gigantica]|uniref:Uncharacterized protein n=1 Tax=Fasciola gigantica TaxID=46835 RepID=A0A504YJK0_FASGI|nr:hypothetical protein FGIG_03127 [Fasciola gigantica]